MLGGVGSSSVRCHASGKEVQKAGIRLEVALVTGLAGAMVTMSGSTNLDG